MFDIFLTALKHDRLDRRMFSGNGGCVRCGGYRDSGLWPKQRLRRACAGVMGKPTPASSPDKSGSYHPQPTVRTQMPRSSRRIADPRPRVAGLTTKNKNPQRSTQCRTISSIVRVPAVDETPPKFLHDRLHHADSRASQCIPRDSTAKATVRCRYRSSVMPTVAAALSKVIMVEHPAALPVRSIRQSEKSAFPASNSRSAFQTVSAS